MRYGDTWPASTGRGGPAITTQPPIRDRTERLLAYEVWKLDQADTTVVLAVPEPAGGAS